MKRVTFLSIFDFLYAHIWVCVTANFNMYGNTKELVSMWLTYMDK